jgi:hypothetical protein
VNVNQAVGRRWRGSRLYPIRVSNLSIDPLVNEDLSSDRRSGNGVVPVVAHGKNPVASSDPL